MPPTSHPQQNGGVSNIEDLFNAQPPGSSDILSVPNIRLLLKQQANVLTTVATGGPRIQSVNASYIGDARTLTDNLERLGLPPAFPWENLWEWHGQWSRELPSYAERRALIQDLAKATLEELTALESRATVQDVGSTGAPTWEAVDRRIDALIKEMNGARDRDDWQDVGRRSREIIIDVAKLIAPVTTVPKDTEAPKAGDAKTWLDLFLAEYSSGKAHAELRVFVRAAWDLAQKVTHGDISHTDAFAAAQAVVLVTRVVQQLRAEQDAETPPPPLPGDQSAW